jgi:hypothetical protein
MGSRRPGATVLLMPRKVENFLAAVFALLLFLKSKVALDTSLVSPTLLVRLVCLRVAVQVAAAPAEYASRGTLGAELLQEQHRFDVRVSFLVGGQLSAAPTGPITRSASVRPVPEQWEARVRAVRHDCAPFDAVLVGAR